MRRRYSVDGVPVEIETADWFKVATAAALMLLSTLLCLAGFCIAVRLVLAPKASSSVRMALRLQWCMLVGASFVFSLVAVVLFVGYMGALSHQFGVAYRVAVAAVVLDALVTVLTFWLHCQHKASRPRRRRDSASVSASRMNSMEVTDGHDRANLISPIALASDA